MATPRIPVTLGKQVTSQSYSWEEMVVREWGSKWRQPDKAYRWSSGSEFDCTDQYTTGIYSRVTVSHFEMLQDASVLPQYGDMHQPGILLDGIAFNGSPGALDLD
jgi:hypothetical protein